MSLLGHNMKINVVVSGIKKSDMNSSPEKWINALLKTPEYGNGLYRLVKIISRKQLSSQNFYPKTISFVVEVSQK